MKRKYQKPEIKTVSLRLSFIMAASGNPSSGSDTDYHFEGGDMGENGDPNNNSRSWGQGMWDEMD